MAFLWPLINRIPDGMQISGECSAFTWFEPSKRGAEPLLKYYQLPAKIAPKRKSSPYNPWSDHYLTVQVTFYKHIQPRPRGYNALPQIQAHPGSADPEFSLF